MAAMGAHQLAVPLPRSAFFHQAFWAGGRPQPCLVAAVDRRDVNSLAASLVGSGYAATVAALHRPLKPRTTQNIVIVASPVRFPAWWEPPCQWALGLGGLVGLSRLVDVWKPAHFWAVVPVA